MFLHNFCFLFSFFTIYMMRTKSQHMWSKPVIYCSFTVLYCITTLSANGQFKKEKFFSPVLEAAVQNSFTTSFKDGSNKFSQRSYSMRYTMPLLTKVAKGKQSGRFSAYSIQALLQGSWTQPRSEATPLTYDIYDVRAGARMILFPGGHHAFLLSGKVIFKGDQTTFLDFNPHYNGSLLYHYNLSQNMGVHVGATYTDQLDKTSIVPIAGIFYKKYPVIMSLFLPVKAKILYTLHTRWNVFGAAELSGYNVVVHGVDMVRNDVRRYATVRNRGLRVMAGTEWRVQKGLRLETSVGMSLKTTFSYRQDNYINTAHPELVNGGFVSIKFFFSDGYENPTSHAYNFLNNLGLSNSGFYFE